jgi:hypothetical protein
VWSRADKEHEHTGELTVKAALATAAKAAATDNLVEKNILLTIGNRYRCIVCMKER